MRGKSRISSEKFNGMIDNITSLTRMETLEIDPMIKIKIKEKRLSITKYLKRYYHSIIDVEKDGESDE